MHKVRVSAPVGKRGYPASPNLIHLTQRLVTGEGRESTQLLHQLQGRAGNYAVASLLAKKGQTPSRVAEAASRHVSLQRRVHFQSTLENGWWNFIREHSGQEEATRFAASSDIVEVFITALRNVATEHNKLGRTLALVHLDDDEAIPVRQLGRAENVGKIERTKWMGISVDIFSNPRVGSEGGGFREEARSLPQQMVTVAHEWDLHVVPYLELAAKIREFKNNEDNAEDVHLEGGGTIRRNELFRRKLTDHLTSLLTSDDHKNYRNVAAFHKTIINKLAALKRLKPLQEDPSGIKQIRSELDAALAEQAKKYDWDQDELLKYLNL